MAPSPTTPLHSSSPSQVPPMAGPEPQSRAPEESIQRLQRVRANLRLPDRPFAAPSADHDAGLRALRLLDFVRIDLPSSGVPRPDLVAELIANYSSSSSRGWSSVRGNQIEVSLDSFAKALRLPPHGTPAGSATVDGAAVAAASREFTRVYIDAPAEASTDVNRLPSSFLEKDGSRAPEYTTELLWELVKQEMEHLIESDSTDCVSYYVAFLQMLIWVEMPELFQPPPELTVAVALPAALLHENQKGCSESDIGRSGEAGSKQIDMAAKKIDSASRISIAASMTVETPSKQLEQAMQSLDQALVTSKEKETNGIDRSEASPKQIDVSSRKTDSASKKRKQKKSPNTERRSPRLSGHV